MRKLFLYCLLFLISTLPLSAQCRVNIKNQRDFDSLSLILKNAIGNNNGNRIVIKIRKGSYFFNDDHLKLTGIQAFDKSVLLVGKNVNLISRGEDYKDGDIYNGVFSYNNSYVSTCGDDIPFWTHVKQSDRLIEVVDEQKKICRLHCDGVPDVTETSTQNAFIRIPAWYLSYVYKIIKIDKGYIYFSASNLARSYGGGWNVNDDFNYGKKSIRFYLCNVDTGEDDNVLKIIDGRIHLPRGVKSVHENRTGKFALISQCKFKLFSIKGLNYIGNSSSASKPLIDIIDTKNAEGINISNCSFNAIKGRCISVRNTNDVVVKSNFFKDCYGTAILSNSNSARTKVIDNSFESMGKGMWNTFCVQCSGAEHFISDNRIVNFGYGAIAVGEHYKEVGETNSSGIIERNKIYYTDDYKKSVLDKTLMDAGAIYLWTKNNGEIIRYNFIRGYTGVYDNRGIFCDDGAFGFSIYGNIIQGIDNSYCIDSRRYMAAENSVGRTNINNKVYDNIIDGTIRFEGNEIDSNGCEYGSNYFLTTNRTNLSKQIVKNAKMTGDDLSVEFVGEIRGKIGLSSDGYKTVKKSKEWKFMKKNVVKK